MFFFPTTYLPTEEKGGQGRTIMFRPAKTRGLGLWQAQPPPGWDRFPMSNGPQSRHTQTGGEGGIRTHGALRHSAFRVRGDRPLCHLSGAASPTEAGEDGTRERRLED